MDICDVLIVGGGPAGSSCAWALRDSGLDVLIVDRATFPREKLCGGWITPLVLEELEIDAAQYGVGRTLQRISGFRVGTVGSAGVAVVCGRTVSYGIRRCEFDEYLLRRCGARLREGYSVNIVERHAEEWVVNGEIRARMLVGAGGHFCPIPRMTGDKSQQQAVVAREVEFEMSSDEVDACPSAGETPELYFSRDMKGYGWCFRKGSFLNIGLGRLDPHRLGEHVEYFLDFLKRSRQLKLGREPRFAGHAYFLFGHSRRKVVSDALLLVGDSAGLAFAQSGEGIRPAIESGLLAAAAIVSAEGDYSHKRLQAYEDMLDRRFAHAHTSIEKLAQHTPAFLRNLAAPTLLRTPTFARFVVEQWFLRDADPKLLVEPLRRAATRTVA